MSVNAAETTGLDLITISKILPIAVLSNNDIDIIIKSNL
jgi:hypothetical protein